MMNKPFLNRLFFFLALLAAPALSAAGAEWMTDYEAAKARGKAENRHVLVEFTGSDWCTWCIRLNDEVFGTEAFKHFADENLILVKLDFPRRKEVPAEVMAQNRAIAERYEVRGFPTIIILNPAGEIVERTGYRRGGEKAYIEHLKGILAKSGS